MVELMDRNIHPIRHISTLLTKIIVSIPIFLFNYPQRKH